MPLLNFKSFFVFIVLSAGCFSPQLHAKDKLHLSGFASFAAGKVDRSDGLVFMDYDGEWSFKSDTMLGLQAKYMISDRWTTTAQVVSRGFSYDGSSDFEPDVEWLFAKFQWTSNTSIRVGRMRTPLYLFSDTLEIGYSYVWARPPVDTYTFVMTALNSFDGADISTSFDFDSFFLDVSIFGGEGKGDYLDFNLDFDQVLGTNFKFQWDDFLIRYGVTLADTDASSASLNPLIEGYEQFAALDPFFGEIAEAHITDGALFQYHSLGARWDVGDWTFIAEQYLINGPDEAFANDAIGWYVSISKQIGAFSPYFVAGYYKNDFNGEIKGMVKESEEIVATGTWEQIPPLTEELITQRTQLQLLDLLRQTDLEVLEEFEERGESYTVGVRYDFHAKAALKVEFEYLESTALLLGEGLKNKPEETMVTTIIVDVVF